MILKTFYWNFYRLQQVERELRQAFARTSIPFGPYLRPGTVTLTRGHVGRIGQAALNMRRSDSRFPEFMKTGRDNGRRASQPRGVNRSNRVIISRPGTRARHNGKAHVLPGQIHIDGGIPVGRQQGLEAPQVPSPRPRCSSREDPPAGLVPAPSGGGAVPNQ